MITSKINEGVPEVSVEEVFEKRTNERLIDVRRPEEFNGELGHIDGADLITLGPDLEFFFKTLPKNESVIFVCRSGGRSAQATLYGRELGFTKVMNMQGGMLAWNAKNLPVVRQ